MLILLIITIKASKLKPDPESKKLESLLTVIQEEILDFQNPISESLNNDFFGFFKEKRGFMQNNSLLNKTLVAKALVTYAKLHLYGLNSETSFSFKKSLYFFKLAAELGSIEGLYFQAFLSFFQLDGTLFFRSNLQNYLKENEKTEDFQRFDEYLSKRHLLNSFISLHFSAIQNHSEAILAMGYIYLQGLNGNGGKKSCSTAAIYYHEVNKQLYLEHESFIPKYIEKKRLSLETIETEISHSFSEENEELEFLRMQANQNKLESLLKLAYYHFYGLKGVARNYETSFEYFAKAAHLGDISAKTSLGYMYLKGIGVTKSHKLAYKEFNEASLRKDSRAKCGLGMLYMNGWGVEKNERLALSYFKEAADAGNPEGQYLYGSHLLSSNQKNLFKQANEFINLAAHQGHAAAMYALGLLHLDGNHLYYSCEIALGMMRSAAERGVWADKMKLAHRNLKSNNKKLSFLLYLESSFLGMTHSHINSALLADKFEVFSKNDLDFSDLSDVISNDPVFKIIKEWKLEQKNDIFDFIYDDIIQIIPNKKILPLLLNSELTETTIMNKNLAKNAYLLASKESDPFAYLRLGDFYYYGLVDSPDYTEAAKYYEMVISSVQADEIYLAQAYFNLAYMHQYGLGVTLDLNKSFTYYNKTYELNRYSFFSVKIAQFLLEIETEVLKENGVGLWGIIGEFMPKSREIHAGIVGFGIFVWIVMEILRVRQRNLIESYNYKIE